MKFFILVIDDEIDSRKASYERLVSVIQERVSGFEIDIHMPANKEELVCCYERFKNQYSLVLLDAVLSKEWRNFTIQDAVGLIGSKIPVAILSDIWDQTNSQEINLAWRNLNCRTFLHWRDIKINGDGDIDYAVTPVVRLLSDNHNISLNFDLKPCESIKIVHISDIQTGGFDEECLAMETMSLAGKIKEHWGAEAKPLIAITGDVSERASPSEYDNAVIWIKHLMTALGCDTNFPSQDILCVPGNHDVNLMLAAAARIEFSKNSKGNRVTSLKPKVISEELINFAYRPYKDYLAKIWNCPFIDENDPSSGWVETKFRHLGVVFYGLNTTHVIPPKAEPVRKVDPQGLTNIQNSLQSLIKESSNEPPLIIGLSHHNPLPSETDESVENSLVFKKYFSGAPKTALFLIGHAHKQGINYISNSDFRIVVSSAPTLTKKASERPEDTLRGINLLELFRENGVVKQLRISSYALYNNSFVKLDDSKNTWARGDDAMFYEKENRNAE